MCKYAYVNTVAVSEKRVHEFEGDDREYIEEFKGQYLKGEML